MDLRPEQRKPEENNSLGARNTENARKTNVLGNIVQKKFSEETKTPNQDQTKIVKYPKN